MSTSSPPASSRTWALWLGIAALLSTVVALCVALLKVRAGADTTDVVLSAGGGFTASAGLCLAVPAAVRELKRLG
ncbi:MULTISPECIES: hypothetical protein [unclassified Streptomyces]|uniref:Secreted protein n=1 Tax=Streptomyces niveiscabiei TaxID=164115 RepID=A0ABW9HX66_9ACTN|nr:MULTISPECIES: hypothetical protein [unclassified Streptomyces]QZZ28759.1 hypothetical protein A7X85_23085 [Streptomyces sp. ST1015]